MYEIELLEGWDIYFKKMDNSEQQKIMKKIEQLEILENPRHLKHGNPNFVVETGQHRICFRQQEKKRFIIFTGNHKQYKKWIQKL